MPARDRRTTIGLGTRVRLAAWAGLAGWVAGFLASLPAQAIVGWRDSAGEVSPFLVTLAEGLLVWAVWTLLLTGLAWCFVVMPCVVLLPPSLLLRFRLRVVMLALLVAAVLVVWRMHGFQDHAASRLTLRFILYMPYGALALGFAVVTASWYIHSLATHARQR